MINQYMGVAPSTFQVVYIVWRHIRFHLHHVLGTFEGERDMFFFGGVEVLNFCFCKSCCPETQPKPISSTVIWMMVSIIIIFSPLPEWAETTSHSDWQSMKLEIRCLNQTISWSLRSRHASHDGVFKSHLIVSEHDLVKYCWWTKSCTTWDG